MGYRPYQDIKVKNGPRYDQGRCFNDSRSRHGESAFCKECLAKKTRTTVKAYKKKHPNSGTVLCGLCDKPGHNSRTCGRFQ